MKVRSLAFALGSAPIVFSVIAQSAFPQSNVSTPPSSAATAASGIETNAAVARGGAIIHPMFIDLMAAKGLKKEAGKPRGLSPLKNYVSVGKSTAPGTASTDGEVIGTDVDNTGDNQTLPLWTFRVRSSRDGNQYSGTMVGRNPFRNPGKTNVPTKVIPLIINIQNIAVSLDPMTGIITTQPGDTTFDPTRADTQNACLTAPNNVPTRLVKQSPILSPTKFVFGGTSVGTTQYSDAFQRANFWKALGKDRDDYHVLLDPVQFLEPIVLDVPSVYGVAITDLLFFGPPASCAPLGIVDINWFDTYLTGTVIPSLANEIDPTNFPIFMVYNVVWAAPANNLSTCCILGYHGTTGFPIPTQTYSPADFDASGALTANSSLLDTEVLSHEVDEWMDDPMISNPTPPWGNTGQVQGACQANLEVGDPLSGTNLPQVTMPNGFSYHLQELAFFSWFFGAPSIGVNGWYSDNGTFLTDAGSPCH
jgi:hypothetical protein